MLKSLLAGEYAKIILLPVSGVKDAGASGSHDI